MTTTVADRANMTPARRKRRQVLRQRWDALVNATLVVLGGQIMLIGAGLQLNLISVRRAVEHQRLGRLVLWVFEARGNLSHVRAQELELFVALLGAAFIAFGVTRELVAWYSLARRDLPRRVRLARGKAGDPWRRSA